MIISASRRTDIPALYADWFFNRIKDGYAIVRNPMNFRQLYKVSLKPEAVDCIVFWTKDPYNMMSRLDLLNDKGYKYYFQFTLTPYDRQIEANLRDKCDIMTTFITLSRKIGRERLIWRYDPIIINDELDINYHKNKFRDYCGKLCGYTETVVVSFVDLYASNSNKAVVSISEDIIYEIAANIAETACKFGISAKACCVNHMI